jgi:hypothetical protein
MNPMDAQPAPEPPMRSSERPKAGRVARAKAWGGYAWFMSFGTLGPLPIFLLGYLWNVTLVGAPVARELYRFGLFFSTMGQPPPGEEKLKARQDGGKKSFVEKVNERSPAGWVERRGRPVPPSVRVVWFVLVGWWLGLVWVVLAWSVLLLPYPFLGMIRELLDDLPSVLTLAEPEASAGSSVSDRGRSSRRDDA